MKKIYFFLAILLVAGFSACEDNIDLDVAPPQSNPQEGPQVINGFTIVKGDGLNSALVLTGEEQEFQVVKATATPTLAEGATVVFKVEISDTPDFLNVVELPTTSANNAATVLSSNLSEAVKTLFNTKAPVAHDIYLRNYFFILEGTSASMIPTPADFGPVGVTPYSNVVIEPAYYLIGDVNGWDINNLDGNKFSHSGQSVYDDPIFTITTQMSGYFKIVPQSSKDAGSWDGVLGNPVDGNTDLEGVLGTGASYDGAMRILESQTVKITINMLESTYQIQLLGNVEPAYYLIGDINGWSFDNLADYQFSHSGQDVFDDPVFSITAQMPAGYFKIVPQSAKDAGDWGGVLGNPVDGNTDLAGVLGVGDSFGGAMRIEEAQWVKITINMREFTYKIELLGNALQQLYVAGGHQGWNPAEASVVFSPNLDWRFDGYVYMEAGNEFKFTSVPGWDGTNYGDGGGGTLSTDGGAGNLTVSETGFFRLTVDLSNEPYKYTATATEWGLIGSATGGGWDTSTPMELNIATGEWTVTTALKGGEEFKFRANDGWDINLGGNVNDLTYNGANIPVASDGTYLVTLKLGDASAYTCTIVKQ